MSAPRPVLGVGVLGAGTVGSQVIRILQSSREDFAARSGAEMEVRRVLVRNVDAPRDSPIDRELLTTDPAEAIDGMDLVVELIGGIEPARTFVLRALTQGISVVTGNKALTPRTAPSCTRPPPPTTLICTMRRPSPVPFRSSTACANRWRGTASPLSWVLSTARRTSFSTR